MHPVAGTIRSPAQREIPGIALLRFRTLTVLVQHALRHHADGERDLCRYDNTVIGVAGDGHEVRDEMDRAQCISDRENDHGLCVPRNPRVIPCTPECINIALKIPCPAFE